VLIADDSELVRMGLKALLSSEPRIRVLGEAPTVASAVQESLRLSPDVLLLDIRFPDGSGFEACKTLLADQPSLKVLVLTSQIDDNLMDEAIRCGAHGYLLKEIDGRGLIQAILDVAAGKSILDPAITARVLQLVRSGNQAQRNVLTTLSTQEHRVLALIAAGRTNKEVASDMGLAEKTVKNYLANVFDKLHVTRRAQAAALFAGGSHVNPQH
jgi:two-component system response regulator DevR